MNECDSNNFYVFMLNMWLHMPSKQAHRWSRMNACFVRSSSKFLQSFLLPIVLCVFAKFVFTSFRSTQPTQREYSNVDPSIKRMWFVFDASLIGLCNWLPSTRPELAPIYLFTICAYQIFNHNFQMFIKVLVYFLRLPFLIVCKPP